MNKPTEGYAVYLYVDIAKRKKNLEKAEERLNAEVSTLDEAAFQRYMQRTTGFDEGFKP